MDSKGKHLDSSKKGLKKIKQKRNEINDLVWHKFFTSDMKSGMSLHKVAGIISKCLIEEKGKVKGTSIDSIKRHMRETPIIWKNFRKKGRNWVLQL